VEFRQCPVENLEMNWKGKRVLVTGGTGFVGSHLVKALLKRGASVVSTYLDLDPYSYFATQKLAEKTTLARVDLTDFDAVHDLVTSREITHIFHLGAQALVGVAYHNPRRTLDSNVMGTVNVLESARLYGRVQSIVVASSDKAYGKASEEKYTEDMALRGDHPYEVSKSATDLISYSYFKTYGVRVAISRFGNIYGEGDLNFSRIIPGAIASLVNGETLEIRSDGKHVRDYLYVRDVVDGYLLLSENIEKTKGEAYNFGSYETLSVIEVLRVIENALGEKLGYKILNTAKNEIPYQSLNSRKIEKQLGWKPRFTISGTIEKIHFWYQEYFEAVV